MKTTHPFVAPVLGSTQSKVNMEAYEQAIDQYNEGNYLGAFYQLLDHLNPEFRTKYGNANGTEFHIPHGSILVHIRIADDRLHISADFLILPEKGRVAMLRQVADCLKGGLTATVFMNDDVLFPLFLKRGKTPEEDKALENELLADEKELSEHNMLVDLGRNDLGRVSRIGTVEVTDYMMIHRYSKIMHICSQVEGDIDEKYDACDAIEAVLPAGTLSGAPKIRACEIIEEQESEPRGVYGGALGYLDFTGNMDTCIAIRMAAKKNGIVTVQAGGGIVADSVPHNEYMESANKAKAVMNAIERASEVDG